MKKQTMSIKMHSVIAANCIKLNLENQYVIWLLAKELAAGQGKCPLRDLKRHIVQTLGISDKTFYNYLNKGDFFWHINEQVCFLKSLEKVIACFKPLLKISACFEIDCLNLLASGITPKEICMSAVMGGDKFKKPLSLKYMADILDCSVATVKRNLHPRLIKTHATYLSSKPGFKRHWNSYEFIAGKRLSNKHEKRIIGSLMQPKHTSYKLKKSDDYEHCWEILELAR
jgi:hypothetical protein